jgi:hypothetical protein
MAVYGGVWRCMAGLQHNSGFLSSASSNAAGIPPFTTLLVICLLSDHSGGTALTIVSAVWVEALLQHGPQLHCITPSGCIPAGVGGKVQQGLE